jgi:hypothetical protein
MYVVETTGGCITRLRIDEDGNRWSARSRAVQPASAWPDGIAFDSYGNLGHSGVPDKLFVLTPQGDQRVLLDEGDPKGGRAGAGLLQGRSESRAFRDRPRRGTLMASVTFGGPDLKRPTSARCADRAFRISARPYLACRWSTEVTPRRDLCSIAASLSPPR